MKTCFLVAICSNFALMMVRHKWCGIQVTFSLPNFFFFFFAHVPESIKLPPALVSLMYFQFQIFPSHHSPHINLPIQIPLQHAQPLVKVFCHFLCKLAATRAPCV